MIAQPAIHAIAPRCEGSQLAGRFAVVPGSAGAGNIVYKLTLTNRSWAPCTLTGLPEGRLLNKAKTPLPTRIRPANPGALAAILVTLRHGEKTVATARFSPDVNGVGETGNPCEPKAYWLRVLGQGGSTAIVPILPATSVCLHGQLSFTAYGR